jgi:hypothetical protein
VTSLSLSPETLAELRARHVAFLTERLVSDRAKGDWARSLDEGYAWLLTLAVRDVLDPSAVTASIARVLTAEVVRDLAAPVARDAGRRLVASLRTDDAKLGDYVPADARTAIEALLARRDLVPEALVRRVFEQEAIGDLLRDVLYDALMEFNDTVNPFFAEWGLPGLIKRFVPIGGGAVLKSMGVVRGEFDKRLEPEIRKFLLVFSRKAKGKLADFVIAKGGDPNFVTLRTAILSFAYEQSLRELVAGVDDAAMDAQDKAALSITLEVLSREHPRERLREALAKVLEDHGGRTVGEALAAVGATAKPDFSALAEATWPAVKAVLASPVAARFFEQITGEFYDSLAATPSP